MLFARTVPALLVLLLVGPAFAGPPAFRTDASPADEKTPWYVPRPGEFPPPGSAHYLGGELIGIDHINRAGTLRQDRDESQRQDTKDNPVPFRMLPYGAVRYHGAPAEIRDLPIGTHLHGQFYPSKAPEKNAKTTTFELVLRLEDDFSYMTRLGRAWRVDGVQLDKNTLSVTAVGTDGKNPDPKPTAFAITPATRVWRGRGFGELKDLAAGQSVQLNLTVRTLKGPGRVTDVWLDDESRALAAARQTEVHRLYEREHGLPGWVEAVDNQAGTVTVNLFDNVDPKLREPFKAKSSAGAAVAEDNLRTYDQINDTMRGPILAVRADAPPAGPGDSGVHVTFKPEFLIEGYRPKRIVRLFWGGWKVDDLPKEEQLYK